MSDKGGLMAFAFILYMTVGLYLVGGIAKLILYIEERKERKLQERTK